MISHVAVVVPAADEQDDIGACLAALLRARTRLERTARGAAVQIVVVLDGCRDATAAVVARYDGVHTVVSSARCVGTARGLGVERALSSVTNTPANEVWLASTDADSRVPRDWLIAMTEHADRGEDVVLGTVRPTGLSQRMHLGWHAAHRVRDDHPYVHGANLGVRASAYARLGGWRDLHSHEDVDFVDRAVADGHVRIHRSADPPVITSSRRHGRAPLGFAAYLTALDAALTVQSKEEA